MVHGIPFYLHIAFDFTLADAAVTEMVQLRCRLGDNIIMILVKTLRNKIAKPARGRVTISACAKSDMRACMHDVMVDEACKLESSAHNVSSSGVLSTSGCHMQIATAAEVSTPRPGAQKELSWSMEAELGSIWKWQTWRESA